MKMTNPFEHTSAHWVRYSDYEWRKAHDGNVYLMPVSGAQPAVYDPIPVAGDLVVDAINIGLMLFHKAADTEIRNAMLAFARQYGLLGLMTALPTTPRFIEYEKVYLLKNQFIRQESMDTDQYLKLFFPYKMPDLHKQGVESLWTVPGEDRMQAALAMTFHNDPQAKAMSFMKDYGERYDWLKEIFRDWAFTFVSSFMYYHDREIMDRNTLELYKQGLSCFEGNAPSYHLELRDHTVMVWDFHSLMMAIKFLFSMKLTDPDHPMKMCEHCQKAFIAKRADMRFCSEACRSKHGKD